MTFQSQLAHHHSTQLETNMNPLHGKVSNFQSFIHRWQSLRSVPFRRRFFVGYDLDGNSYWEFYVDGNKDVRPRRIVDYREQKQNWVDYKMPRK